MVLLKEHVRQRARNFTRLLPGADATGAQRSKDWEAVGERKHRGGRMIPRDYITQWRERAPWTEDFQVEQDLVISRALVEIFSDPVLAGALAFRGRHGALQALPDTARAVLRGYRSGSGRAWAGWPGDGRLAKRPRSLAWRRAVEAVAGPG